MKPEEKEPGCYLDDLMNDPEKLAKYLQPPGTGWPRESSTEPQEPVKETPEDLKNLMNTKEIQEEVQNDLSEIKDPLDIPEVQTSFESILDDPLEGEVGVEGAVGGVTDPLEGVVVVGVEAAVGGASDPLEGASQEIQDAMDPLDLSDIPLGISGAREEDCESGHGPSLPMSPHR